MANSKLMIFDGQKAVSLWGEEGWVYANQQPKEDSNAFLSSRVAIVFRGMNIRANAVASIPFDIINLKGDVVDTTDDWKNKLGFMPNPQLLFWLIESAWTLYGKAYLYQSKNSYGIPKVFRYLAPESISYDLVKDEFTRTLQGTAGSKKYPPALDANGKPTPGESIVPLWFPDPDVEKGEPKKCPGSAALSAMGVIYNLDQATTRFFKNGMLHTTLFAVPPGTGKEQKEELEERINVMLRGIKNAFKTLFINADDVKPVDIGGGLSDLGNMPLTKEKREDVAIALGIPMSKLFTESAAGLGGAGVSNGDDRRLVSDTALPDWGMIAAGLNQQVLEPMGFRMVDRHEQMEIFQENRQSLGTTMQTITSALKQDMDVGLIVARYLGINFSEEDERALQKLAADQSTPAPVVETQPEDKPEVETEPDNKPMTDELMKFRRKAMKSPGKAVSFDSVHIPAGMMAEISAKLTECKSADEVKALFDGYSAGMKSDAYTMYTNTAPVDLAAELKRANDLLEHENAGYARKDTINITMPEMQLPTVNVYVPDQKPVVNVTVDPTPITVNQGEVKVNVNPTPINVQPAPVTLLKQAEKLTVKRDANGKITGMTKE